MSKEHKRSHIHVPRNLGERIADGVVGGMGSWRFIIIQTVIVAIWIISNIWILTHPFDPYPLILLNLVFSTQAAYASPIILMAANRQSTKDHARDDLEAQEVADILNNHQELLHLQRQLLALQNQQMEILNQQTAILEAQHAIVVALQEQGIQVASVNSKPAQVGQKVQLPKKA